VIFGQTKAKTGRRGRFDYPAALSVTAPYPVSCGVAVPAVADPPERTGNDPLIFRKLDDSSTYQKSDFWQNKRPST